MNKLYILPGIVMFFSLSLVGQHKKITIQDINNKQAIPYVSVIFKDTLTGMYANEKGEFSCSISKSVKLTCIGYKDTVINISNNPSVVYMKPVIYVLDAIKIMPSNKEYTFGFFHLPARESVHFVGNAGCEYALYIPNTENRNLVIKKIVIGAQEHKKLRVNDEDTHSVFRVNIYKVKSSHKIGELINTQQLLYGSKILKEKTVLDISHLGLTLPPEGVFVSIEYLGKQISHNNIAYEQTPLNYLLEPSLNVVKKTKELPYILYTKHNLMGLDWTPFNEGLFCISIIAY